MKNTEGVSILPCAPYLVKLTLVVAMTTSFAHSSPGVALIVVDVQECFMNAASPLHVTGGGNVVPTLNALRSRYGNKIHKVALIQDLHCPDHVAFASQHPARRVFDTITLQYDGQGELCRQDNMTSHYATECRSVAHHVTQILWPDHCIVGKPEADFSPGLIREKSDLIIKTGNSCQVDTYSAFRHNGGFIETELDEHLQKAGIRKVLVTGVALEYGVYYTTLDSLLFGYETYIILDATASASDATQEITASKLKELRTKGAHILRMEQIEKKIFTPHFLTSSASSDYFQSRYTTLDGGRLIAIVLLLCSRLNI